MAFEQEKKMVATALMKLMNNTTMIDETELDESLSLIADAIGRWTDRENNNVNEFISAMKARFKDEALKICDGDGVNLHRKLKSLAMIKLAAAAKNMMDRLPKEIMIGILSRLPITCLVQSMLVCRAWRSLIKDPILVSEHVSRCMAMAAADHIDPIFIFQSHHQHYFFDNTDLLSDHGQGIYGVISLKPLHLDVETTSSDCLVDNLDVGVVRCYSALLDSCNGLLCMLLNYPRSIYICNPFTNQYYLHLPDPPKLIKRKAYPRVFDFRYHPTTKEYKVVATYLGRETETEVHVLTVGSRAWRNIGGLPHGFVNRPEWKVKIQGRLHWVSWPINYADNHWNRVIVSLDLATEQFEEVHAPCVEDWGFEFCCLTVLGGCLSVVYHTNRPYRQLEIWVMKEYGAKESWVKDFIIRLGPRHVDPQVQQVVCILKSGDILLYSGRAFCVYDPRHGTLVKELMFPRWLIDHDLRIVSHAGSFSWLDTPITC